MSKTIRIYYDGRRWQDGSKITWDELYNSNHAAAHVPEELWQEYQQVLAHEGKLGKAFGAASTLERHAQQERKTGEQRREAEQKLAEALAKLKEPIK
jgi:hypothetical protein